MNKFGFASIIAVLFIAGCVETPSAKSAAWQTAWKDGQCTKDAGDAAYTACVEKDAASQGAINKRLIAAGASAAPQPSAQASAPPAAPPPQASAPVPPPAPPQAPPPAAPAPPQAPMQQTLKSGVVVWVPVASGPYCSVQDALAFEAQNESDFLVEVRGVVPLNCDGQHFTPAKVVRRSGVVDVTWVVSPHTTAQFTSLPLNGGLGDVEINFDMFLNLGPGALAPTVGFLKHTYHFPRPGGGKNYQSISPGVMQMYSSLSVKQTEALAQYMPFVPRSHLATVLSFLPADRIAMLEGSLQASLF
jgi:hypothetical protein